MIRYAAAVSIALLLLLPNKPARACDPIPCEPGFILGDDGQIPMNAAGILWTPARGFGRSMTDADFADRVRLATKQGNSTRPLPSQVRPVATSGAFFVTPRTGLRAGTTLVLEAPQTCEVSGGETVRAEIEVVARAEHPTALGTLGLRQPERARLQVATDSGACSTTTLAVFVDVEVLHHESARPWTDLLAYETRVDGEPYRPSDSYGAHLPAGASWVGRGRDRIYALCDEAAFGMPGVDEGTHRVEIIASLPGTDVTVRTPVAEIELDCGRRRSTPPPPEPEPEPAAPATAADDSGCSAAGPPRSSVAAVLLCIAVLCVRRRL